MILIVLLEFSKFSNEQLYLLLLFLVSNQSYFEMLSFFCFYFIAISG